MTTKELLREIDLGLMKIDKHLYIVLAKDENRFGDQLFKTQLLNTETMGYGETQYALQSFDEAIQNFNYRIHIDFKKKMQNVQNEFNTFKRYIREKLRDFIKNDEEGYHSIGDIEELLEDIK